MEKGEVDFVELFMDLGVDLETFFNENRVKNLFPKVGVSHCCHLLFIFYFTRHDVFVVVAMYCFVNLTFMLKQLYL